MTTSLLNVVAVVGNAADRVANLVDDSASGGHLDKFVAQAGVRRDTRLGRKVGSQTSNMRRGHRGTRVVCRPVVGQRGQNTDGGAVDVYNGTIVGVLVATVIGLGAADGADLGGGAGRVVLGVVVVVTGGDGHEVTSIDHGVGRVVERLGVAAAQRATHDVAVGALGTTLGGVVLDKVVRGDEVRVPEGVILVDDLDAKDGGLFGDTVAKRANRTGAVRAVAEVVNVGVLDEGLDLVGTALEFL